MEALFDAVRKACSAETWSRGVQIARTGAVLMDRAGQEEIVVRLSLRGGMYCPAVSLFPADAQWECSCGSPLGACEHVAAAVIALRRAREGQAELTRHEAAGRVSYRLSRRPSGLRLERFVVTGDEERRLDTSLAAIASGRAAGPRFAATPADLAVEASLGANRNGPLPKPVVARLLTALAGCADVRLDGRPVRVGAEPVKPLVVVEDQDDGFRLVARPDPSVTEVLSEGLVLCGDELRRMDETCLTAREAHELPRGRRFGPQEVAELVAEVLPSLRRRVPVQVLTDRLPGTARIAPRIVFEVRREGTALDVLPTLVYGDPPAARVDAGRLVPLGGELPVRNEAREREIVGRLGRELDLAPGVRTRFEGEAAVRVAERIGSWRSDVRGEGLEFFRKVPPLVPRVRIERDAEFDVVFETSGAGGSGGGRADAGEVLRAWRDGASLVPVTGGGWAPLPADWLERFGHRVADLLAAREASGRLPPCVHPDLARFCDDLGTPRPASLGRLGEIAGSFRGIPKAPLPADLGTSLRPYQRDGVHWLDFLRDVGLGALLADDMGLGKTVQALAALEGRSLVVCPRSVLHNWEEEARRFRPALSRATYHGEGRALDRSADVTLTTYAILRLDEEILRREAWATVVLDEAQTIKNPDSQVARAAFSLDARFRIALTGTPVENRLEELWSLFHFLNRGLLGGRDDFLDRYARPIALGDAAAAGRLRERIRPFVLRRLKRDVAPELPPRTEVELRCELTPEEREVYDTVRAAALTEVVSSLRAGGSVLAALEALLRLRQAACHPGLVPGREAETSSKVELLLEALDSVVAEGHKALVFSQWTSLLDRIEPRLRAASIPWLRLDGSTRDRAGVVGAFQDDSGPPVLLVSLRAGGTGLNLTAADHVFLMDPWWNPAVEDQAADRTHRIGQDKPVMVYRLVAESTVEERILGLKEAKRRIADAALGGGTGPEGLTRDDLLALLA